MTQAVWRIIRTALIVIIERLTAAERIAPPPLWFVKDYRVIVHPSTIPVSRTL
jgi:hypothetical protein